MAESNSRDDRLGSDRLGFAASGGGGRPTHTGAHVRGATPLTQLPPSARHAPRITARVLGPCVLVCDDIARPTSARAVRVSGSPAA